MGRAFLFLVLVWANGRLGCGRNARGRGNVALPKAQELLTPRPGLAEAPQGHIIGTLGQGTRRTIGVFAGRPGSLPGRARPFPRTPVAREGKPPYVGSSGVLKAPLGALLSGGRLRVGGGSVAGRRRSVQAVCLHLLPLWGDPTLRSGLPGIRVPRHDMSPQHCLPIPASTESAGRRRKATKPARRGFDFATAAPTAIGLPVAGSALNSIRGSDLAF